MPPLLPALHALGDAAAFGVAEAIEGVRLRQAGITQPILVLVGVIPETLALEHRVLVPPHVSGELIELAPAGEYTLKDVIGRVQSQEGRFGGYGGGVGAHGRQG